MAPKTASDKAAAYDRRFPDSINDFAQKVERQERLELKEAKAQGGRGVRTFSVPELPWHRAPEEGR